MAKGILVINSGSTSVKFAAYRHDGAEDLGVAARGQVAGIGDHPHFIAKDGSGKAVDTHEWEAEHPLTQEGALKFIFAWLKGHLGDISFAAAGHRVVQGGLHYAGPVLVDEKVLAELDALSSVEPSHQPIEVAGIRAAAKASSSLLQVACFDTSFHRTMPQLAQLYALPKTIDASTVRHWGYHGLSYDYISRQVPKHAPKARRVIVAHLGGGCSMCAMLDGKSQETSMGFSGIEGLAMSTRCGAIDPGVLLYLLRTKTLDAAGIEAMLYKNAGLLGLSGISGDMIELLQCKTPEAALAIDYFVYQIAKYVGAYTSVLGGLDAIVFTAGIGENAAAIRAAVLARLGWLGVKLDAAANARNGPRISTEDSAASVWVIPTNEELMIAQHTLAIAKQKGALAQSKAA